MNLLGKQLEQRYLFHMILRQIAWGIKNVDVLRVLLETAPSTTTRWIAMNPATTVELVSDFRHHFDSDDVWPDLIHHTTNPAIIRFIFSQKQAALTVTPEINRHWALPQDLYLFGLRHTAPAMLPGWLHNKLVRYPLDWQTNTWVEKWSELHDQGVLWWLSGGSNTLNDQQFLGLFTNPVFIETFPAFEVTEQIAKRAWLIPDLIDIATPKARNWLATLRLTSEEQTSLVSHCDPQHDRHDINTLNILLQHHNLANELHTQILAKLGTASPTRWHRLAPSRRPLANQNLLETTSLPHVLAYLRLLGQPHPLYQNYLLEDLHRSYLWRHSQQNRDSIRAITNQWDLPAQPQEPPKQHGTNPLTTIIDPTNLKEPLRITKPSLGFEDCDVCDLLLESLGDATTSESRRWWQILVNLAPQWEQDINTLIETTKRV